MKEGRFGGAVGGSRVSIVGGVTHPSFPPSFLLHQMGRSFTS